MALVLRALCLVVIMHGSHQISGTTTSPPAEPSTPKGIREANKDLYWGIGAGIIGALVIVLLVILAILLYRRFRLTSKSTTISGTDVERSSNHDNRYKDNISPFASNGLSSQGHAAMDVCPSDEAYECACHPRKDSGPYAEIQPYDNPAFVSMNPTTNILPKPLPHIVRGPQLTATGKVIVPTEDPVGDHPQNGDDEKT